MSKSERPPLLMVRRGSMFVPASPMDSERVLEFPAGKPLKVVATQPRRSVPHLRLYWAALKLVCDNLDADITPEVFHEVVKVRLGYTVKVRTRQGEIVIPGSIAFDAMDQHQFRDFFDRFKDFVVREVIPGVGRREFEDEARLMLGDEFTGSDRDSAAKHRPGVAA